MKSSYWRHLTEKDHKSLEKICFPKFFLNIPAKQIPFCEESIATQRQNSVYFTPHKIWPSPSRKHKLSCSFPSHYSSPPYTTNIKYQHLPYLFHKWTSTKDKPKKVFDTKKSFRIARINYSPSHEAPDYLLLWVSKTNINNLNDSQADREGATRSLCINFRLTTNSMLKNSWNFNFTLLILPSQNFSPDCECKALFGTELLERDKNIIILW